VTGWLAGGELEVVDLGAERSRVLVPVALDEPVFQGHYPGFPIFPGVCVVECVRRAAVSTLPHVVRDEATPELAEVVSARFLDPVAPGDRLAIDISWRRDGDGLSCAAVVSTGRGPAARMRLRFALAAVTGR